MPHLVSGLRAHFGAGRCRARLAPWTGLDGVARRAGTLTPVKSLSARPAVVAVLVALVIAALGAGWYFGPPGGREVVACAPYRAALQEHFAGFARDGAVEAALDVEECEGRGNRVVTVRLTPRDERAETFEGLGRAWVAAEKDPRLTPVLRTVWLEAESPQVKLKLRDSTLLSSAVAEPLAQAAAGGVRIDWDESLGAEPWGLPTSARGAQERGRLLGRVELDLARAGSDAAAASGWRALASLAEASGWTATLSGRVAEPDSPYEGWFELPVRGGAQPPSGLDAFAADLQRLASDRGVSVIVDAGQTGLRLTDRTAQASPAWTPQQDAERRRLEGVLTAWGFVVAPRA